MWTNRGLRVSRGDPKVAEEGRRLLTSRSRVHRFRGQGHTSVSTTLSVGIWNEAKAVGRGGQRQKSEARQGNESEATGQRRLEGSGFGVQRKESPMRSFCIKGLPGRPGFKTRAERLPECMHRAGDREAREGGF
ncbi:hypothetical protein THAOC_10232 [Thalassiosira oceanica]|uniref:Uncharacterized protein n=1 Tax=Thalassiosira oceanica TaxID=159749 RepID=K0ST56_THAOC|nr:hypothetical protein THAOC_17266 [Thalassiosira oceanica]EJK68575.1 hypothetical protein THAOC_10232 [Thalassiosira oceanica]|eukprot:EJK62136.1 hypothetical protein THAOC_17266 [Thalassiosira oceanica]